MLHRILPLLLMALLPACAREAARPPTRPVADDPLASNPWRPSVAHQECVAVAPAIASVTQLADSSAIAAAAEGSSGHALWTIAFDANGIVADLRLLEATMPDTDAGRIGASLRGALQKQAGEEYVRLRLDTDGVTTRLRVGGVQYCKATLLNPEAVGLAMGAVDRAGVIELRIYVDQEGRVQEREVLRSSGVESTDRMALGLVSHMQYSPARLERLSVPARLNYRVNLD